MNSAIKESGVARRAHTSPPSRSGRLRWSWSNPWWALCGLTCILTGCFDVPPAALTCPCTGAYYCFEQRCVLIPDSGVPDLEPQADAGSNTSGQPDSQVNSPTDSAVIAVDSDTVDAASGPGSIVLQAGSLDLSSSVNCVQSEETLLIRPGQTRCVYESPVLDMGSLATLQSLRWVPRAPYGKGLPGGQAVERYRERPINMRDNLVLLRMDEDASAEMIEDRSGNQNHCQLVGQAQPLESPVGPGLLLDRNTYCTLPATIAPGADDFTWLTWFRTADSAEMVSENRVFLGGRGMLAPSPALWFGLEQSCNGNAVEGATLGGLARSNDPSEQMQRVIYCGEPEQIANDDQWHLAALRRTQDQFVVHYDRDTETTTPLTFSGELTLNGDAVFNVSAFADGSFPSNLSMADLAVFRRPLSVDELESIYLRGALSVEVRVRACALADCSDSEYAGPDRSTDSSFTDFAENLGPDVVHDRLERTGRYVQVRVELDTQVPDLTPEIESIELAWEH